MRDCWILSLALLPALVGCGGTSAAERQMADFRKEIARVQADNDRLNERVTALETTTGNKPAPARTATPSAPSDQPKLKVVKLVPGQDDETPEEGAVAAKEQPDSPTEPDTETTVIRVEGARGSVSTTGSKDKAARSAVAGRDYDAAVGLIKKKQYDKALESLAAFLVKYPDDQNADNAMYWRGECFYAKGDYSKAAEQFSGLIARFPRGNKVPDALLKLGMSQSRAGEKDRANETFAKLKREHPQSEASRKIPKE